MKMRDGREVVVDRFDPALRYNVYDCPGIAGAEGRFVTIAGPGGVTQMVAHAMLAAEVDEGVTPMFMACPEHANRRLTSRMYRVDAATQPDLFPVRILWRRATMGERKRERRSGGDHFARGGLAREWV